MTFAPEPQPKPSLPVWLRFSLTLLYLLVFISIGLNMYLLWQLLLARQQASQTVQTLEPLVRETFAQADAELQHFQQSTLTFEIQINHQFPLHTEIPFRQGIEIPVRVDIPIQEEVQTTVMMDPFNSGFQIPVEIEVPIDMVFPVDQVIPIAIEEPIPISTTLPISMTVPINVKVSDTDLVPYLEKLQKTLDDFEQALTQTLANIEPR